MRMTERARNMKLSPLSSTEPEAAAAAGRFTRLVQLAGRGFIPLGLFARVPLAMLTVGTLTLVTATSGSYALGGAAAGAVGIGSALGAPVLGSMADRRGQRPVLLWAAGTNTAAVLALVVAAMAVGSHYGFPAVLGVAFLAGASCPQVGPLARVRWMALTSHGHATQNRRDLDTALSYEGTADEMTFVLGPALVGILASLLAPWLPLVLAAVMTLTLVPAFAVHRTHHAVPVYPKAEVLSHAQRKDRSTRQGARAGQPPAGPRVPAAVALPVAAMLCMGTFFGATQAALSAFSATYANLEIAGLLYAAMGLSSAASALSVAYWPQRFGLSWRWLASAALMAALAPLLLLPESVPAMVLVLLILGLPVGPVMVTVFGVGGLVAPAGRLGAVMTGLASGIVAGTALGSAVGGQLAQDHGHAAAFLVPAGAAAALAILGAAAALVLHRRDLRHGAKRDQAS